MRVTLAILLAGCASAAPPTHTTPVRPYYVAMDAPACVEDESELGAAIAALRFENGSSTEGPLTPAQSVLVRAAHDCTVTTRARVLRLTTSESYADACRPEPGEDCEFVRSCWAIGGPSDRACDAATAGGALDELVQRLSDDAASSVIETRDPAARPDVPTVYVETGTSFFGHGHLVQRVDGAWRVVVAQLVWQS